MHIMIMWQSVPVCATDDTSVVRCKCSCCCCHLSWPQLLWEFCCLMWLMYTQLHVVVSPHTKPTHLGSEAATVAIYYYYTLMDRPINCFDILDWLVAGVSLTTGTLLWYTAMEIADSRPRVIYVPSQRHVMSVVCDISIACDVHSVHKNCMCWTVTYSVDKLWHSCQFSGYFLGEPWLADWLTFRLVFFLHVLKENFWW